MGNGTLRGSLPHVLTDTDAVDDDPSRVVHFSIALEKCGALGAIITSTKEKGGELSTLEIHFLFFTPQGGAEKSKNEFREGT